MNSESPSERRGSPQGTAKLGLRPARTNTRRLTCEIGRLTLVARRTWASCTKRSVCCTESFGAGRRHLTVVATFSHHHLKSSRERTAVRPSTPPENRRGAGHAPWVVHQPNPTEGAPPHKRTKSYRGLRSLPRRGKPPDTLHSYGVRAYRTVCASGRILGPAPEPIRLTSLSQRPTALGSAGRGIEGEVSSPFRGFSPCACPPLTYLRMA